ncbi:MAG: PEP-CTERM sorting domain-containing protein [Phycisphaerae bacterium]|nr:PEP-CTERM sorting domain-containing protein [Phycisphaerae bacterium]
MMRANWSIAVLLVSGVVLGSLASEAQARRNFEYSCGQGGCHTASREVLNVAGHDDTIDLGLGELKVFDVEPGGSVGLTADVSNVAGDYAISIVSFDGLPLNDSAGWTSQDRGAYYTTSYSALNISWTYLLDVDSGADEGYYRFGFTVGGRSDVRWSDFEQFYVNVIVPLPTMGDTNGNDIVNDYDYNNLVAQFGGPPGAESADFNNDGTVNLYDFALQRENFGFGVPPAAPDIDLVANAPEPATLSLMLIGGAAVLRRRRRRT